MKKLPLILSLLLLSVNNLSAQMPSFGGGGAQNKIYDGKISGIILDSENGKPVELANVALYKSGATKPLDGTVSDEKGSFRLKNIKPGKYKVSIWHLILSLLSFVFAVL